MSDTAAQWVLAQAYIARHDLCWSRWGSGRFSVYNGFDILKSKIVGRSYISLFDAVLDYQEQSGKGWGS